MFGYYAAGETTDGEIITALQYLVGRGIIALPASDEPAAAPPDMSAVAAAFIDQAEIAECFAGEQRRTIAARSLDLKASRDYTLAEYTEQMVGVIVAGNDSVRATES